jgi:hypothetical protein
MGHPCGDHSDFAARAVAEPELANVRLNPHGIYVVFRSLDFFSSILAFQLCSLPILHSSGDIERLILTS